MRKRTLSNLSGRPAQQPSAKKVVAQPTCSTFLKPLLLPFRPFFSFLCSFLQLLWFDVRAQHVIIIIFRKAQGR